MSFDLFVYMRAIPSDIEQRVESALARWKIAAKCRYDDDGPERGGTLGIAFASGGEFEHEDDATFVDFRPLEEIEMEESEGGTPEERAIVRACRWEASVTTSAGRDLEALEKQVRAGVAVMEACGGVLHDPQRSANTFLFDLVRARQWAEALIAESR